MPRADYCRERSELAEECAVVTSESETSRENVQYYVSVNAN